MQEVLERKVTTLEHAMHVSLQQFQCSMDEKFDKVMDSVDKLPGVCVRPAPSLGEHGY